MIVMKRVLLIVGPIIAVPAAFAQAPKSSTPDLTGVYELVPHNVTLPAGLKNAGSPEEISLLPAAAAKAKATDLSLDTAKDCQILEVKVTAEDPKVLTKPSTYTRYYRKVDTEISQYVCTDDLVKPEIPAIQ